MIFSFTRNGLGDWIGAGHGHLVWSMKRIEAGDTEILHLVSGKELVVDVNLIVAIDFFDRDFCYRLRDTTKERDKEKEIGFFHNESLLS